MQARTTSLMSLLDVFPAVAVGHGLANAAARVIQRNPVRGELGGVGAALAMALPAIPAFGLRLRPGMRVVEKLAENPARELDVVARRMPFREPTAVSEVIGRMRATGLSREADNLTRYMEGSVLPDVQYHGTKAALFDVPRTRDAAGFHVGTQEQSAARLHSSNYGYPSGSRTLPLAVSVRSPIHLPDLSSWAPRDLANAMRTAGATVSPETWDRLNQMDAIPNWTAALRQVPRLTSNLVSQLEKQGVDAISYLNQFENANLPGFETSGWSHILFHPNQVKSLLGNAGTFSKLSPNIYRGFGGALLGAGALARQKGLLDQEQR